MNELLEQSERLVNEVSMDFSRYLYSMKYINMKTGSGKSKSRKQIKGMTDAYIVKDDLEYPAGNALPLWLFGFLY